MTREEVLSIILSILCGKGITYHLGSIELRKHLTKELERILKMKQNNE